MRTILRSGLNAGNIISVIKPRAASVIRYWAGIIDWTLEEPRSIDAKTRKILTIDRSFHLRANIDMKERKEKGDY